MSETTKFTESEMQSIAKIQTEYQQSIFVLGQVDLEKADLEQQVANNSARRTQIFENWKTIQKEEADLINQLSQKYGDGALNIKDGTFRPAPVTNQEPTK